MWRRILLAAIVSSVGIGQAVGADVQPWAGLDFAKSIKRHHLFAFRDWPTPKDYPKHPLTLDLLTDVENVLPDPGLFPPLKQHFEYVLPRMCVSAIAPGPDFKCVGRDKDHLVCSGMVVTVRGKVDDCLQINVVKEQ